jgi:hypothetical protein
LRKINVRDFKRATRSTSREINRQIALNLVHEHQPISRADLARMMGIRRGMATGLVNELLEERLIYEGEAGESSRGRKPTLLYVRTHDRLAIAIDIRFSRTHIMLADFAGSEIAVEAFPTIYDPDALIEELGGAEANSLDAAICPQARTSAAASANVFGFVNRRRNCRSLAKISCCS